MSLCSYSEEDIEEEVLKHCRLANVKEKSYGWPYTNVSPTIFDDYEKRISREYIVGKESTFAHLDSDEEKKAEELLRKSALEQESILLNDLLYTLQGIKGDFISASRLDPFETKYIVNKGFDSSLRNLAHRILPLASDFSIVNRFSTVFSSYRHGIVVQAFSSLMKKIVEDYMVISICQFERELRRDSPKKFTLQKLYFYIQPIQRTLKFLAEICRQIEQQRIIGGGVLTLLYNKIIELVGDEHLQQLCSHLLNFCAKPYMIMLQRWIFAGEIFDPFNEFMVRESVQKDNDLMIGTEFDVIDNWECRYIFKSELCPCFLMSFAQKIVNCGKYLNIVYSCGLKPDEPMPIGKLPTTVDEKRIASIVENGHKFASKSVIRLLLNKFSLLGCFRSLKHYFFLDQGDWLSNFLHMAYEELILTPKKCSLDRLENFFDMACRSSSLTTDVLRDKIKLTLKSMDLTSFLSTILEVRNEFEGSGFDSIDKMDVFESHALFSLKYDSSWPLCIIFNRKIMTQYEIIFRRLLQCKFLEMRLSWCWISMKDICQRSDCLLLHQMITFVKNYLYHITVEVLEPNWLNFYENFSTNTCNNLDETLNLHNLFMDECTKDCMLTDARSVQNFQQILDACWALVNEFEGERLTKHQQLLLNSGQILNILNLKNRFDKALRELLEDIQTRSITTHERLWADLAFRLDIK